MDFRFLARGEIPSILRVSGNPRKAFSAEKLSIKWLDFILVG